MDQLKVQSLNGTDFIPAPTRSTGHTVSAVTGDDASQGMGISFPSPRFVDNGDGTVSDVMTNLVWLKDSTCTAAMTWNNALDFCANLQDGTCSLTDGSIPGDWRLPNILELQSLIDFGYGYPAICNAQGTGASVNNDPFTGFEVGSFWSSTLHFAGQTTVRVALVERGATSYSPIGAENWVWPVRDLQ